ncbi:PEP/pyruvate-binding domain-containing protein [Oleidesulfovibrio sp.]|uniref:PEP/pyruvate-binding domain-containing protein n=1 Tax=Oleidesulfovibrio sp. TaxID=2909707 RepID=UPI003A879152
MALKELFRHWTYQAFSPGTLLRNKYNAFKELLRLDDACLELIADLEEIHYGREKADWARVVWLTEELGRTVRALIGQLQQMSPVRYMDLPEYLTKIEFYARMAVSVPDPEIVPPFVFPLAEAGTHGGRSGGKARNLGRILRETDISVPEGVVVSTSAYHYFIEANDLRGPLDEQLRNLRLDRPDDIAELSGMMRGMIMTAEVPDRLADEIEIAALELGRGGRLLAVRSSAVAEDGEASFAGQYTSELGVRASGVLDAWKSVIAGKYTPRALAYRIMHGLADPETPMATIIMPMIDAQASGVVYTRDPSPPSHVCGPDGVLSVFAVQGAGEALVSGTAVAEAAYFRRGSMRRAEKVRQSAGLPASTMKRLTGMCLELEKLFGVPQDVEWAMDTRNRLHIVQSRPVPVSAAADEDAGAAKLAGLSPVLTGGECASPGIGSGTVCQVEHCAEVDDLPEGSVLVTRNLGPALTRVIDRLSAVVARQGSRASHFASVAREFGLPVIVGVDNAFDLLPEGTDVTVDATHGIAYSGCPAGVCGLERKERLTGTHVSVSRVSGVTKRMKKAMEHISRLTLLDAQSETFAPRYCKSLHDFVRFAHEKGVAEMFSLVGRSGRGLAGAKQLKSTLPVSLYVLNLEDGLFPSAAGKKEITPDDVRSVPMWALWFGLASDKVRWNTSLPAMDWESFDRVSAGVGVSAESQQLASYAVVSHTYLHFMARFGYHLSVVDTLCEQSGKNNYINFRFKGGGGTAEQRALRLNFISSVLQRNGFFIDIRGDLLDARHPHDDDTAIQKQLAMLGLLLARTRLMDMSLFDTVQVEGLVEDFIALLEAE